MYGGTLTDTDFKFAALRQKVPDLKKVELIVTGEQITTLPCKRPWLTGSGMGLIGITDIRRGLDGKLEFQLGDQNNKPYSEGKAWVAGDKFGSEWPE